MLTRIFFLLLYSIFLLLLFWLCRAIFIGINLLEPGFEISFLESLQTFYYGFKLDVSAAAYLLIFPLIFLAISCFSNNNLLRWLFTAYSWIIIFLIAALTAIDVRVYKYFGYHIDFSLAKYLKAPGFITASMSVYDSLIPVLIFLVIFVFGILIFQKIKKFFPKEKTENPGIGAFILITILLAGLIIPIRGGVGLTPVNIGAVYFSNNNQANHSAVNLIWNVVYSITIANDPSRYHFMSDEEAQKIIQELLTEEKDFTKIISKENPNVLLIILESYTSKLLTAERDGKKVTPNFHQLIPQGIFFPNFYASGSRTDRGVVSILSGYPSQPVTAIIHHHKKAETLPNLFTTFDSEGYKTHFYYGGDVNFFNMRSYLRAAGVDKIVGENFFSAAAPRAKWGVHDGVLFDTLANHILKMDKPFFVATLTLTSHEPYIFPGENLFEGDDDETKFLNSAHYTDAALGNLIEKLRNEDVWQNLLVIITADHGHALPGYSEANSPQKHHVPMLWLGGALSKTNFKIQTFGTQSDIAETLLSQLNFSSEDFTFSRNLFSDSLSSFAWYSFNDGFGIINEDHRLVYDSKLKSYVLEEGPEKNELKKSGEAYLQTLMNDFSAR